jgi:NAD-dependent deacetylase
MTVDFQIGRAIGLLKNAQRTVALTGAGISTPSGIPDFRSPDSGLWQRHDPLEVASIYAFQRRPQDFFDWIQPLAKLTIEAQPNAAHIALAQLERHGRLTGGVITQNIDMLHHRAGSQTVYEVHGHLRELTCIRCYTIFESASYLSDFILKGETPYCDCGGVLKPNVILFGEQPPARVLMRAKRQAQECDLMLVVGSSLTVAPVCDLPLLAVRSGAHLIVVNYEETHVDHLADVVIRSNVVDALPKLAAPFLPASI